MVQIFNDPLDVISDFGSLKPFQFAIFVTFDSGNVGNLDDVCSLDEEGVDINPSPWVVCRALTTIEPVSG
jgi:hypothetical protein